MLIKKTKNNLRIKYEVTLEGHENPGFEKIVDGWMDALEFHEMKSQDYKARDEIGSLGAKGEFPKIWGKIGKLKTIFWDGKDVLFEGGQELLMDLMGSVGLMLMEQRKIKDKYSAGWRINSANKPTFGPGPYDLFPDDEVVEQHKHQYTGKPSACACGYINPEEFGDAWRKRGY